MATLVSSLEVEVKERKSSVDEQLSKIIARLEEISAALNKSKGRIKGTGEEIDKTKEKTKKGTSAFDKFFRSIVRIAGYRAIRASLSALTKGLKEGLENITQYSKALDNTDAGHAQESMSAYNSTLLKIKNSLGAALVPLLNAVLPMIEKLSAALVKAIDFVTQLFAAFNGQKTYTKAKDYWAEYGEDIEGANKSAQELKRTILGFDEINALSSNSSGGGSSNELNYAEMFEEVDNPMYKYANEIQTTFRTILELASGIGMAIAAWKVGKTVSNIFKQLGFSDKAAGNAFKLTAGLGITVVGNVISFKAGKNFAKGEIAEGIAKMVGGTVASGAGGAMVGSSIASMLGASTAAGGWIGLAVGVGISLISTVVGYIKERNALRKQEYYKNVVVPLMKEYGLNPELYTNDAYNASLELAVELKQQVNSVSTDIAPETQAQIDRAKQLISDIFSFDDVLGHLDIITPMVEELNALGLEGIHLEIYDNGTFSKTREDLEAILEDMIAVEKAQAMSAARQEAWGNLSTVHYEWEKLVLAEKAAHDAYVKASNDGKTADELGIFEEALYNAQKVRKEMGKTLNEAKKKYADIFNASNLGYQVDWKEVINDSDAVDEYQALGVKITKDVVPVMADNLIESFIWAIKGTSTTQTIYNATYAPIKGGIEEAITDADYGIIGENLANEITETSKKLVERQELREQIQGMLDSLNINNLETQFDQIPSDLQSGLKEVFDKEWGTDWINKFGGKTEDSLKRALKKALQAATEGVALEWVITPNTTKTNMASGYTRANGGTVYDGNMFWAGERAPEILATSPHGTEVINMVQFERAISSAVRSANNGGGNWTIVLQDADGNIKSTQVITAAERANRRDGRTVIPVGT